jgi:hypothetical protein
MRRGELQTKGMLTDVPESQFFILHASTGVFERFRRGMARSHRQVSNEAAQIKDVLTVLDPSDPHTICDALRAIHHRTMWLDSIVVRCPIERAEYGTQKRAVQ